MLGVADSRPDPGRGPDHAGPHAERRLGDLDRDAQAPPRPGRGLARPDARPGAGPDAGRRLLGRPRRAAPRPAARHRRHRHLAGPAPARGRGPGGDHPAGGSGRGGRARRNDGLDDAPAGRRRGREHELPRLPPLRARAPDRAVRHRRRRPGRGHAVRRASATTYPCSAGSRSTPPCARAATRASRSSSPTPRLRPRPSCPVSPTGWRGADAGSPACSWDSPPRAGADPCSTSGSASWR